MTTVNANITTSVMKRDGTYIPYDGEKIRVAVSKALMETQEVPAKKFSTTSRIVEMLVMDELLERVSSLGHISTSVEEIQDLVEKALMEQNLPKTAKAYILYREQHKRERNAKHAALNVRDTIEQYLGRENDDGQPILTQKENASVTHNLGGLILSNSSLLVSNYWLNEKYDQAIADAHRRADLHIHDLGMLSGYCAGWSLKQLIQEGLGGVEGRISSAPASHLSTLCNQMVNHLGIMQNEWAGAQAYSSFDTLLAPFVKVDNLSYKEIKQCVQSFVFGVNTPCRWGTQPPFSNITLDWVVPKDMKDLPAIVGGKEMPFTYGDCKPEMDLINKAFIEVMIEGDCNGRGFQYPIPTYSITKDFDWSDTENNRLLFEMTAKYGTPYFSNYINSDMDPSDIRSMCCRLRLELRELRKRNGGFFGSGESTGSVGVVTINMPRIAYLASDAGDFYKRLDELMDIAARSLDIKRKVINRLLEEGLYPYTKRYLGTLDNHFSTIGLVGLNEAARNAKWLRTNLTTPEGQAFAKEVLNHMRERLADYQEMYPGTLFNLEATPAESTSYRFARSDKMRYPDIITAAKDEEAAPYYTNSSHLPVGFTDDVFEALSLQDELQTMYTSGTVFHAFLGERIADWKSAAKLVRTIAENFKLPYYTMSPTYSVCADHGYIVGEQYECPTCGKKTEVYSRITGYYRPLQNWNDGKSQEFEDRKEYAMVTEMKAGCESCAVTAPAEESAAAEPVAAEPTASGSVILVTTSTCPKCKMAKGYLNEAGVQYETVLANERMDLVDKFGIKSAPTLLVISEDGSAEMIVDAGPIRAWCNKE